MAAERSDAVLESDLGTDVVDRSTPSTTPPANEKIVDDGDLYIDCNTAGGNFLVSSAVMQRASPVFKAMLGPNFAEGQQKTLPLVVVCQEDDWKGMQLMLQLLHNVPSILNKDRLDPAGIACFACMAVVADKYQCTQALSLQAEAVLLKECTTRPSEYHANAIETHRFAIAAYYFNKPKHFYVFTKWLVLEHAEAYLHLLERSVPGMSDVLGVRFILALESQRTEAILHVIEEIRDMAISICPSGGCYREAMSKTFLPHLCEKLEFEHQWPPSFRSEPIAYVLRQLTEIGDVDMGSMECNPGRRSSHTHTVSKKAKDFRRFARKVYVDMGGLCIACVKEGCYKKAPCRKSGHASFDRGRECAL